MVGKKIVPRTATLAPTISLSLRRVLYPNEVNWSHKDVFTVSLSILNFFVLLYSLLLHIYWNHNTKINSYIVSYKNANLIYHNAYNRVYKQMIMEYDNANKSYPKGTIRQINSNIRILDKIWMDLEGRNLGISSTKNVDGIPKLRPSRS